MIVSLQKTITNVQFLFFFTLFSGVGMTCFAQNDKGDLEKIKKEIMACDSILFQRGYNHCDTASVSKILASDFEFYHDQAGAIYSPSNFLNALTGLCQMDYKASRELDLSTTEIHILKNNGEIYAVLQSGHHSFFAENTSTPKHKTSSAKFHHLWFKSNASWKLKRVISFDHQLP